MNCPLIPRSRGRIAVSLHDACGVPNVRYAWGRRADDLVGEYNGRRLDRFVTFTFTVSVWLAAPGHYVSGDVIKRLPGFREASADTLSRATRKALSGLESEMDTMLRACPAKRATR